MNEQTLPSPAIIKIPDACKVVLYLDGIPFPAITIPSAGTLEVRVER